MVEVHRRLESDRDIKKEKISLAWFVIACMFWVLIVLTILYTFLAKLIFGVNNLYVSILLGGLTGGMWSLVFSKAYDVYSDTIKTDNEAWLKRYPDCPSFSTHLQQYKLIVKLVFLVFILEIIIIYFIEDML